MFVLSTIQYLQKRTFYSNYELVFCSFFFFIYIYNNEITLIIQKFNGNTYWLVFVKQKPEDTTANEICAEEKWTMHKKITCKPKQTFRFVWYHFYS